MTTCTDVLFHKNIYRDQYIKIFNIAHEYIKKNKLILYGGTALDYALKARGHAGIYGDNVFPDYDVLCKDFYNDGIRFVEYMFSLGYTDSTAIGSSSLYTYRAIVNGVQCIDFSLITHDAIPTVSYNDTMVVHPLYTRLDYYDILALPYAFELGENLLIRFKKSIARLKLIDQYYPVLENIAPMPSETTVYNIELLQNKKLYVHGLLAYALYYKHAPDKTNLVPIIYKNNTLTLPQNIPLQITYFGCIADFMDCPDIVVYEEIAKNIYPTLIHKYYTIIDYGYAIQCYHDIDEFHVLHIYALLSYFMEQYWESRNIAFLHLVDSLIKMQSFNEPIYQASFKPCGNLDNNLYLHQYYKLQISHKKMPNIKPPFYNPATMKTPPVYDFKPIYDKYFAHKILIKK